MRREAMKRSTDRILTTHAGRLPNPPDVTDTVRTIQQGETYDRIPGVIAHATNLVEYPELVADRLVRFATLVGRENVIAGTDCGLGGRLHPEIVWAKFQTMAEGARLATQQLWGRQVVQGEGRFRKRRRL
jgi:methionine synthase II (cobalamin-independent)